MGKLQQPGRPGARLAFYGPAIAALALLVLSCGGSSSPAPENRPPTANAGADQTAVLGARVTLDGAGSTDPDGDALTYRWRFTQRPAGSGATLSSLNAVRPAFTVDLAGTYLVELVVNDGTVDSAPDTVRIDTLNSAPVANAGPDQSVALGALVQLDGSTSFDPDGDPLSFSWTLVERPAGSAASLSSTLVPDPVFTADQAGTFRVRLVVSDGRLESTADHVIVSTLNSKPVAHAGTDQAVLLGERVTLDGSGSADADGDPLSFAWSLLNRPDSSTAELAGADTPAAEFTADAAGLFVAQLIVNDGQLDSEPDTTTVEVSVAAPANSPPQITSSPVTAATAGQPYSYTVTATDADGDPLAFSLAASPAGMTINAASGLVSWTPPDAGNVIVTVVVADGRGGADSQTYTLNVAADGGGGGGSDPGVPPPDPATLAPPNELGAVTHIAASTAFLYSGENRIQYGVAEGTIEPVRAAVLRGRVMTRAGAALPAVRISIKDHPEFGYTLSRADGRFDLAVNGGGWLTIDYTLAGYLPAQRALDVPWQDFAQAPEVALIPLDPNVTTIELATLTGIAVAAGRVEEDADGRRQARVLFKPGTSAEMVMPDGSTQPIGTLSVRATEYTVGPNGPAAMPGELPATSGYTYAVELSVDEAIAAGAASVQFSQGVPLYVDNFIGFPVGMAVPIGYYDRQAGRWVPAPNGRVIEILSITGGLAEIDADGDGTADTTEQLAALSIDDAERQRLAELYSPGATLWRGLVTHFTPWDYNWPFGPPDDAVRPFWPPLDNPDDEQCPTEGSGSIIECENQALGQRLGVTGTPYTLNYRSSRAPGAARRTVDIPLTGENLPESLQRVELELSIAGQSSNVTFSTAPNQSTAFTWDGLDAYGRPVHGTAELTARLKYIYPSVFREPGDFEASFARFGGTPITAVPSRSEVTISQDFKVPLKSLDARRAGPGGWTLDVHHQFDPIGKVLYMGDGRARQGLLGLQTITTTVNLLNELGNDEDVPAIEARLNRPGAVAVGPDGSIYLTDQHMVKRVGPDGIIRRFAGTGIVGGGLGDGGPATEATLDRPSDLAVGPDGALYIADTWRNRIRRVGLDGIITTVAGNSTDPNPSYSGEGGPATEANLVPVFSIAVGPDGSLYIGTQDRRVLHVGPDGIIQTIAGPGFGMNGFGDGGPAHEAGFRDSIVAIEVGPDASIYVVDVNDNRIRRISPEGIISTFAGSSQGFSGDGGPATAARLTLPRDVALASDGSVYIPDRENGRIRVVRPDGNIYTVAGTTSSPSAAENVPAAVADLRNMWRLAVGPDEALHVVMWGTAPCCREQRVRRIAPPLPGFTASEIGIASEDGGEIYGFDPLGRHLRTINALTGFTLREFTYDEAGHLREIIERTGGTTDNVTTIERDAAGTPLRIIGPYGQVTTLTVDANGWLASIANPAMETVELSYTSGGLLRSFTDARGAASEYAYDASGRLVSATDPAGSEQSFAREKLANGAEVTRGTALGQDWTYSISQPEPGLVNRTITGPDGTVSTSQQRADGTSVEVIANGMTRFSKSRPEPRFGMQAPVPESSTTVSPAGISLTTNVQRTAELRLGDSSLVSMTERVERGGQATVTTYQADSREISTISPAGRSMQSVLNERGRPLSTTPGNLAPFTIGYDERGRISAMHHGDERSYAFGYDPSGNLASMTDPLGRTASFTYDAAGRVLRQSMADGRTVRYSYDAAGNMASLTPTGRPATTFEYSGRGEMISSTPPAVSGSGPATYSYDADGRLTLVTQPGGRTVAVEYDSSGRFSRRIQSVDGVPVGTDTVSYDPAGRVRDLAAAGGTTITLAYDGSLVTRESYTGNITGNVSRAYDGFFRLSVQSVNDANPVSYGYDQDDYLTAVGAMSITRDGESGLPSGMGIGAIAASYSHNSFGEFTGAELTADGTALYALSITRDALGRVTQKVETIGEVTDAYMYAYTQTGDLAAVLRNGDTVEAYAYDVSGNRTSATVYGAEISATYDAQDRVVQYGNVSYVHNGSGDRISRTDTQGTTTYDYNPLGSLLGVELSDGTRVTYEVDARGRRVGRFVNDVRVGGFLYDAAQQTLPVAEIDSAGAVVSRFVFAGGATPAYMIRNGVTYYFVTDNLGSVRLVVDVESGEIAQRLDYDTAGRVLQDTNPGFQPFGFASGLYDAATGLVRFGARDYDAEVGRWTTKDPSGFRGGMNLYRYANNNPGNYVDRNGRDPKTEALLAQVAAEVAAEANGFDIDAPKTSQTPAYNPETGRLFDLEEQTPANRAELERQQKIEKIRARNNRLERLSMGPDRTARRMKDCANAVAPVARNGGRVLPVVAGILGALDFIKMAIDTAINGTERSLEDVMRKLFPLEAALTDLSMATETPPGGVY